MHLEPTYTVPTNVPELPSLAPAFFRWSFGENGEQNPVKAKSCALKIQWQLANKTAAKSLREEVYSSAAKISRDRGNKKIALFHGGGRKSEIILRALVEFNLPIEIFFLDFWGLNSRWKTEWVDPIAKQYGISVRVENLEKVKFFQFAKKRFLEFGIEGPNALAMAYLAENLSEDYFPVVGSGSLDRIGSLYKAIAECNPMPNSGRFLPFSSVQVFPYLWSAKYGPEGEYAFFQSSEKLFQAALTEANWEYPFLDLSQTYSRAFPMVPQRPISSNWDGEIGLKENFLFRKSLEFIAQNRPEFSFWKKSSGCAVDMKAFSGN